MQNQINLTKEHFRMMIFYDSRSNVRDRKIYRWRWFNEIKFGRTLTFRASFDVTTFDSSCVEQGQISICL